MPLAKLLSNFFTPSLVATKFCILKIEKHLVYALTFRPRKQGEEISDWITEVTIVIGA